jgi:hypothetical protein
VVSVHTNVTAWTGEAFNFTMDAPAPLQSVTSDILQALRESESKLPVTILVAIGVAATAVVVVTSFLIIVLSNSRSSVQKARIAASAKLP